MTKMVKLARRLALVVGLIGCGGSPIGGGAPASGESAGGAPGSGGAPPSEAMTTPEELEAAIQQDLSRIRRLEIARLGGVQVGPPANACYQYPCPGDLRDPAIEPQYRALAPRLARLADTWQTIAADPEIAPADPANQYADVRALNQLQVVLIVDLWRVTPANNPSCDSLPCPEDVARADAENWRRAGVLHAWAVQAAAEQP